MRRAPLLVALLAVVVATLALWFFLGDASATEAPSPGAADLAPGRPHPASTKKAPAFREPQEPVSLSEPSLPFADAPLDAGSPDAATVGPEGIVDALATAQLILFLDANAEAAERQVDAFCERARKLGKEPRFAPNKHQRDAAYFMAVRSDWEDGRKGLLHLPDALTQRMGTPPLNWRRFTLADLQGLDFGWMKELAQYDHWTLSADGPLRGKDGYNYIEAPIPNYLTLQSWVKLRLVKARYEGDLAAAHAEIAHLANLCASSGTLVGEMIRAAMLNIERSYLEEVGLTPPEPLPSAEDIGRSRDLAFAGIYFLYPGVKPEVAAKAVACNPMSCSALNEALGFSASVQEFYPKAKGHLAWLLQQEHCDPRTAKAIANGPPMSAQKLAEFADTQGLDHWMGKVLDGGR